MHFLRGAYFVGEFHILCVFGVWAEVRAAIWNAHQMPRPHSYAEQVTSILSSRPGDSEYGAVLALAGLLDRGSGRYWGGER